MKTNPKSLLLYCIPMTLVDSNAVKLFCCCVVAKLCPALSVKTYGLKPARLLCPGTSPGQDTGVSSLSFLQGNFPTQGLNLCLLQWQADSLPLSHLRNPIPIEPLSGCGKNHELASNFLPSTGVYVPGSGHCLENC